MTLNERNCHQNARAVYGENIIKYNKINKKSKLCYKIYQISILMKSKLSQHTKLIHHGEFRLQCEFNRSSENSD